MGLKITFVNPNSRDEVDKYLPKILAQGILNRITKERSDNSVTTDNSHNVKNSA